MDSLVALPVAIPLLGAAALTGFHHFLPRRLPDSLAIAAAASSTAVSFALLLASRDGLLVHWYGGWEPRDGAAIGISFAVDPLGAGMAVLAGTLVTAALVYSWRYLDDPGPLYCVLMLVFCAGMSGFALSGDLFNLFVFFELMGVAAYALTAYRVESTGPIEGALNFAVTNSIGAFMLLVGIGMLYGQTGALNLAHLGRTLEASQANGLVVVAFALVAAGFLVKSAIVPFHFWLADAYAVAPPPVCAVLAGAMSDLGIYGLARVYWTVFSGPLGTHADGVRAVLVGAGVLTALLGAVMCFLQRHLPRLLAFSTISHAGIFLAGIALLEPKGQAGVALYVLAHGLLKAGLFLGAGALRRKFETLDELELHGRGRDLAWLSGLFLAGAVGLAGLPPLGAFLGHSLLEDGAKGVGYSWLVPVLAAASVVTSAAILRAWARIFRGWGPARDPMLSPEPHELEPGSHSSVGFLVVPAAALVLAGLLVPLVPGLAGGAERAAHAFQDRESYAATVLDGRSSTPPPVVHEWSVSSFGYGVVTLLAAAGLAALALGGIRRRLAPLGRLAQPSLNALRAAHSGHVGDYVAWLTLGAAALGGLLTLVTR
jgi:multicomponent Na+:H+ antiporter subunit D